MKKLRLEDWSGISEAETIHWNKMKSHEKKELLRSVRLPSTFARDKWQNLDFRAKEMMGKFINQTTSGEYKLAEEELTPAQKKKMEKIVLSMKKKEDEFKERYGDEWKSVMYATATKMAKESTTDEGFKSDAQRRAAFASGYKAKGKKHKKKNESVEQVDEVSYVKVKRGKYKGMTGIVYSSNGYENATYLVSGKELAGDGKPKIVSSDNLEQAKGSDRKTLIKIHADGKNGIPGHRQVKRHMKDMMRESVNEARKGRPAPLPKATNFAIRIPVGKYGDKKNSSIKTIELLAKKAEKEGHAEGGMKDGDTFVFHFKNAQQRKKFRDKYLKNEEIANTTAGVAGLTPDTVGMPVSRMKKKKKRKEIEPMLTLTTESRKRVEKAIKAMNASDTKEFKSEIEGMPVFKVSEAEFAKCKGKRAKGERWDKFFEGDSPNYSGIRKYAKRNPNSPLLVQNNVTGEMTMFRRRMNDGRLKHNKKKKRMLGGY